MFRRLLPTVFALILGLAALAAGLGALEVGFARERATALQNLKAHQDALQQYAAAALKDTLHRRLEDANERITQASDNPLEPADGLLLVESGEIVLPRTNRPLPGSATPAVDLFRAVQNGTLAIPGDDSPWADRVRLGQVLSKAIDHDERAVIPAAFRALLKHRAQFVVAAENDLPLMIALLEEFVQHENADPRLLRAVLRDGLADSRTSTVEGLQPALLRAREKFSKDDFTFLANEIETVSKAGNVPCKDFDDRVRELPADSFEVPTFSDRLIAQGWYIESTTPGISRGVYIGGLNSLLPQLTSEMVARQLLAKGDEMRIAEVHSSVAVSDLRPVIESTAWAASTVAIQRAFRLKTALIAVCGVFALAIVALALLEQSRRQRYLQLKSDFIATVSHELRTPLASLRVMTETLEARMEGVAGARDYPTRMLGEIDRLTVLVENILSFNRLEKDRWQPRLADVTLSDAVPVIETEVAGFSRAPVKITTNGLEQLKVRADPELLRLLFANLARNACQYNTRDTVEIQVDAARTDRLRVRFSDNGVGIASGDQGRIFGEFYRGSTAVTGARGSGLGLALCRRIMRLHRGTIEVASTGSSGTTFELSFP